MGGDPKVSRWVLIGNLTSQLQYFKQSLLQCCRYDPAMYSPHARTLGGAEIDLLSRYSRLVNVLSRYMDPCKMISTQNKVKSRLGLYYSSSTL